MSPLFFGKDDVFMARTGEAGFQDQLKWIIENHIFPGSTVFKNDSGYIQGFPDLTIFGPDGFVAIIEVKISSKAPYQPNQEYYLQHYKDRGYFTATIYPENMEEVLNALQQTYESRRNSCVPRGK